MKKKYNIYLGSWTDQGMEGQIAPEEFLGEYEGETFREACRNWAESSGSMGSFNEKHLCWWGIKLFEKMEPIPK